MQGNFAEDDCSFQSPQGLKNKLIDKYKKDNDKDFQL